MAEPGFSNVLRADQAQTQIQTLAPQQQQGLRMLAMNLPELRQEILHEMSQNPVIEEVESPLEPTTISQMEGKSEENDAKTDYPEDYDPTVESARVLTQDSEADERRQRFFDSQVKDETLEEHLLAQLPLSDIGEADASLAEMLIGDLDENGRFAGSIPDISMVTGESEERILDMLMRIAQLDPLGCGTRTAKDCLLAQMEKLADSPCRDDVRALIERHLDDVAANRWGVIEADLGIDRARYIEALKTLRTLDPHPGRAYRHGPTRAELIHPEVHAVKGPNGWLARVDARSIPEIHISPRYLKMLNDPATDPKTRAYVRERIEAVNNLIAAIEKRQDTVTAIAQAIFDAQPGFFERGLKGLRPLGQQEIADRVGVHPTTVSRTVNDKYATTCRGTVELRRFFTSGYTTVTGESVSREAVLEELRTLINAENSAEPLSDEALSARLKAKGFPVARRTVAKYRGELGIGGTVERRRIGAGSARGGRG